MGLQDRDWYRDVYQQERAAPAPERFYSGSSSPSFGARSLSIIIAWVSMAALSGIFFYGTRSSSFLFLTSDSEAL
jgi:hypothetical protein